MKNKILTITLLLNLNNLISTDKTTENLVFKKILIITGSAFAASYFFSKIFGPGIDADIEKRNKNAKKIKDLQESDKTKFFYGEPENNNTGLFKDILKENNILNTLNNNDNLKKQFDNISNNIHGQI